MSNFYYKKQYSKKTPLLICCMAIMVPIGVFYHKSLQMKRLEEGIKKDMERIKSKGKKFSDIPKSG